MSILIRGGTVVTAEQAVRSDVRIEGEIIAEIGRDLPPRAGETVCEAEGCYIFPGGVDPHTHFELPVMDTVSADDFRSGSIAALCGGTTTFLDFVEHEKGKPLIQAFRARLQEAAKAVADYSFHMVISEFNAAVAEQLSDVVRAGVPSVKCFMAYKGLRQIDDEQLIGVFETVGRHQGMMLVHAENGDMIAALVKRFLAEGKTGPEYHARAHPTLTEEEAVARIIALARFTGQPIYIVHLSSADGLVRIREACLRGQPVYAETCPQYLLLSEELYARPDFEAAKWVMSPPLRPADHQEKLWAGLRDGFIRTVGTDHCPFNFRGQKDRGRDQFTKIPGGIPAVGDRVNLLYTYGVGAGRISLTRFVDVIATAPAKLFGLYPRKGSITVGADADLVIFDPDAEGEVSARTQHHRCDYSAFEGLKLKGLPVSVLLRGRFAVRDGRYVGEQGEGRFLARKESGKLDGPDSA